MGEPGRRGRTRDLEGKDPGRFRRFLRACVLSTEARVEREAVETSRVLPCQGMKYDGCIAGVMSTSGPPHLEIATLRTMILLQPHHCTI